MGDGANRTRGFILFRRLRGLVRMKIKKDVCLNHFRNNCKPVLARKISESDVQSPSKAAVIFMVGGGEGIVRFFDVVIEEGAQADVFIDGINQREAERIEIIVPVRSLQRVVTIVRILETIIRLKCPVPCQLAGQGSCQWLHRNGC